MEKVGIILIIVAILVVVIIILNKIFKGNPLINSAEEIDTLTMEKVIAFFKNDEIIKILEENSNIKTIVIKKGSKDDRTHILCTLFDAKSEKIVYMDKHILNVLAKNIDDSLSQAFAGKDMIILN